MATRVIGWRREQRVQPQWLSDGGSSHGGFEEKRDNLGVGENKQANEATTVSGGGDRESNESGLAW